jgi:hypothetical protein
MASGSEAARDEPDQGGGRLVAIRSLPSTPALAKLLDPG